MNIIRVLRKIFYRFQILYLNIFKGLVLFLEEDHYVAEDFLSILSLMKHERDLHYPNCDILCLGTYLKQTNYKDDHKKVRTKGFFIGFEYGNEMASCVAGLGNECTFVTCVVFSCILFDFFLHRKNELLQYTKNTFFKDVNLD